MKHLTLTAGAAGLLVAATALTSAQDGEVATEAAPETASFGEAVTSLEVRVEESIAELNALREEVARGQVPLSRELGALQTELSQARDEYQEVARTFDSRNLNLSNLRGEIQSRRTEVNYLTNMFVDYATKLDPRLNIAEKQRYAEVLKAADLAKQDADLSQADIFRAQTAVLDMSIERLEEALGGTRFAGSAVNAAGEIHEGTFLLLGPTALFRADNGAPAAGVAEQIDSNEPNEVPFTRPEDVAAANALMLSGEGFFPLDPSLGNAAKIEATEQTFLEHVQGGGPVMYPIFAMAGLAFLVALFKWLGLALTPMPSRKKVQALLGAMAEGDKELAEARARAIPGPVGRMLAIGTEHLGEPRELIEEVMYEVMLTTKLKLQRALPFIAVCAASAPLLGLLGTVTGIIKTFELITVFGSGDVRTLSGGISEALVTTEFGLIVAIPSLLLHAFLSRKARAMIGKMETTALAFTNQAALAFEEKTLTAPPASPNQTPPTSPTSSVMPPAVDPEAAKQRLKDVLTELLHTDVAAKPAQPTPEA